MGIAWRAGLARLSLPKIPRYLLLLVDVVIVIVSLLIYKYLSESYYFKIEDEREIILLLALVAFFIFLSVNIASLTGLTPGIIELLIGMGLALVGAKPDEALKIMASIGANMLLFMAGSEIEVALLKRSLGRASSLVLVSSIPPVVIGLVLYKYLSLSLEALVVVTASLMATSAALTYSILVSARMTRMRAGQLALVTAMIADVVGMMALSLATASINPLLLLYIPIIIAAIALYPILPRVSGGPFESEIRLVVMALIVLGMLSDLIGVHSILTSFLLGVVVSETVRNRKILKEKLESIATGFFIPFFFIVSGMSISVSSLYTALPLIIVLGLVLFITRLSLAYYYIRTVFGLHPRTSIIIAASTTPLLTVTIIGAEIGLTLGLISDIIYAMLLGVVVIVGVMSSATVSYITRRV